MNRNRLVAALSALPLAVALVVLSPGTAQAAQLTQAAQQSHDTHQAQGHPKHKAHAGHKAHGKRHKTKRPQRRAALAPATSIGVVSFNAFVDLSRADASADIHALTNNTAVDLIGLQEAKGRQSLYRNIPGWGAYAPVGAGAEDVILWRSSKFVFKGAGTRTMTGAAGYQPARYANRASLVNRATGRPFTFLNTHLDAQIERDGQPYPDSPYDAHGTEHLVNLRNMVNGIGGVVLGTGDFNIDWVADSSVQNPGLAFANLNPFVATNWAVMGTSGQLATHGVPDAYNTVAPNVTPRYVDYVFAKRDSYWASAFESQAVLTNLRSDHNAVLTRITLRK